jgi:PAS domain S-box-containing protein
MEKEPRFQEIDHLPEMLNDCSIDRVMAIDLNWHIIAWNKTAANITGITKSDVLGKHLLEVFPLLQQDKEIMDAIDFAFRGVKSFVPAHPSLFNRKFYENHFIPLRENDGQVMGVMNIMHDVAHRLKAEQQLEKLNRALEKKYQQLETASTELATFTYITSNDIKAPLKHVYTSLELLIKTEAAALSNGSKANLRRMQGSLNRMNLLLDDILALSHINSFMQKSTLVDLNDVLREATDKLNEKIIEKKALIKAESLPSLYGFRDMLYTLFVNLLDYALKFQEPKNQPVISIQCRETTPDQLPVPVADPEKQYVELAFIDNGIGFDPKDEERIFTIFEKLHPKGKYPGSGMGLAICKKIVEAHDGFIRAAGRPGQGAGFYCYLPASQKE